MSKILDATCQNNVVTSEGVTVADTTVLSKGIAKSSGQLFLEEDKATYITSNATDIETTLAKVSTLIQSTKDALDKIALTLTSIGAGMTGPTTAPPPSLAADVLVINAKTAELGATKTEVETLKGNLK